LRFKQLNMNHCWQAYNLLSQTEVEKEVDVVIAADPQGITHEAGGWLLSTGTGRAALGIVGPKITVGHVVRDDEFVAARLNGNVFVVSCYVSPRPAIAHFTDFLQNLDDVIKGLGQGTKVIVAGDFNARSAAWGDWETNARDDELAIFADMLNLVIVNESSNPTFTGRGVGSIVDVTMVSENLAASITNWTVENDTDNGSDHQTISFVLDNNANRSTNSAHSRKWNTSRGVELEAFATGILLARWTNPNTDNLADANSIAEDFEKTVTKAADFACPHIKAPRRTAVH